MHFSPFAARNLALAILHSRLSFFFAAELMPRRKLAGVPKPGIVTWWPRAVLAKGFQLNFHVPSAIPPKANRSSAFTGFGALFLSMVWVSS